jgi:hypothetical protein
MAAPRKTSKSVPRPAAAERQRLQLSPLLESAKRFKLAAVSLNLSETELFERLIDLNFPGLHVQNLSKSPFFGGAGQGCEDSPVPPAQVGVMIPRAPSHSRIGMLARSAAMPVDNALDRYDDESIPA